MYNAEQKLNFITGQIVNDSEKKAAEALFEATQKFEQELCCDLCHMSKVELENLFNNITGLRHHSKPHRIYIVRNYIKWCINSGVDNVSEDVFKIDIKEMGIDKFRWQTVANPCQLQMFLNWLFAKECDETVDCIYRCYCWLAFIGVKENDAMELTKKDVDMYKREVYVDKATHAIYNEAAQSFEQCVNLSSFNYKHRNYNNKVIVKQRAYGDRMLRGLSDDVNRATYRVELSRRQTYAKFRKGTAISADIEKMRLSYYRIQLSGIFYRAYEHERAGIKPEFMSVADYFLSDKERVVPSTVKSGNERVYVQKKSAASYYEDYRRWKIAHSI